MYYEHLGLNTTVIPELNSTLPSRENGTRSFGFAPTLPPHTTRRVARPFCTLARIHFAMHLQLYAHARAQQLKPLSSSCVLSCSTSLLVHIHLLLHRFDVCILRRELPLQLLGFRSGFEAHAILDLFAQLPSQP